MGADVLGNEARDGGGEARLTPRTNMFIAAVLVAAEGGGPVRIRNMSRRGALAEAAVLPAPGARVQLVRGSLTVAAEVVWRDGKHCGLRLASEVTVADWMSNGVNRGQGAVDGIVAQHRAGAIVAAAPAATTALALPDEVALLARLIDALGEELAGDTETLMRHAGAVQNLDIAAQMCSALGDAMSADAGRRASGEQRLVRLRDSCRQALGD